MTFKRNIIKKYGTVEQFLESKETFQSYGGDSHIPSENQITYESPNDFKTELIEREQLESKPENQTSMENIAQKALSGMTKGTIYEAENQLRKALKTLNVPVVFSIYLFSSYVNVIKTLLLISRKNALLMAALSNFFLRVTIFLI